MILGENRHTFTVCIADSNSVRNTELYNRLSNVGYTCVSKFNIDDFKKSLALEAPHIIILQFGDRHFFTDYKSNENIVRYINASLPHTLIIVMGDKSKLSEMHTLYQDGVYDCLVWPSAYDIQLVKSVDRAAMTYSYKYLHEQQSNAYLDEPTKEAQFSTYSTWLKAVEKSNSLPDLVELWMKEALRITGFERCAFFKYIQSKKSLLLSQSIGIDRQLTGQIGLDLALSEPGYDVEMLDHPNNIESLTELVNTGFNAKQSSFYTLKQGEKVKGVFAIVRKRDGVIAPDILESSYLHVCLHTIKRQLSFISMNEKLNKYSIFDPVTEVLNREIVFRKLKEEVSRSRRINKPVSLLFLSIDEFHNFAMSYSQEKIDFFLRALAEIFVQNSRITDLVGRVNLDQFAICLPHTSRKGAAIKADRLRQQIERTDFSPLFGETIKVTVSIGVSEYPSVSFDSDSLFDSAEKAYFEIKKITKNKIFLATVSDKFVPDFFVNDGFDVSKNLRNN